MREFLRYLFVVAAMLMVVVGDAWGQTYNDGTWYSLYNAGEFEINTVGSKEYSVFAPTNGTISFNWYYNGVLGSRSHETKIYESNNNGGSYTHKGTVSGRNTNWPSASISVSRNINKIKFARETGNTWTAEYKNIKLPLAKHILLESGVFGTSSITVTDGNLATAEGYTSTTAYKIKLRSFLASGNIKMTSSNSEFHFGGGVTEIYLGVANNYCASANGSGTCTSVSVLGQISNYFKDVYFSPSVQYNTTARWTTITITDGVNTAYVHLTAPVIPTYYFKAEAIAEPTTGGVATAKFVNGANTYSLVAPSVGTNSMSADVTFEATATGNSVFEGWKKPSEDAYYKQGAATYQFVETITSNVLDPSTMASQKTYRAIFSERFTAKIETNDISGLKVGASATAVYSFVNTSADVPSVDENADFHYVITHRPDNTTKSGSADASKVVSFDPNTKQVVGLNSGSATITFVQKQNATHEYVAKSFDVTVEKNAIDAWIVRGDAVLNELVGNAFSVTDGMQDYHVESLNPGIAEYVAGNKIQTYYTEGTARFSVTRAEDYKYVGLNKEFALEVRKSGEICYVLENQSGSADHVLGQNSNGTYSDVYTLNGVGEYLSYKCKLSDGADAEHYLIAQYSTLDNGEFYDLSGSNVSTKNDNEHVLTGLTLPEGTKRIRFKRTAQTIGTKDFSIYDIDVTRKKGLDHQVAGGTLVLPQANMNQTSQKSFNLKWSTCADEILLVSDNALFEVSTTRIDASAGGATNEIVVKFKGASTSGVYTATIHIYDQTQKTELHVSCEVKAKLATEIVYSGESRYGESGECLEGLFFVRDENGDVVADAEIVLASSNDAVLEVCGNAGFQTHCGGQVILTATYAGDELREGASWSEEMFVENCNQVIVWNQNFRDYIAATDGSINESRVLSAYADPTRFVVTYELDAAAQAFARLENGSLVVTGIGTGHIIASAPAGMYQGKMYDATSVMHEIRVSRAGDECETEELLTSDEITLSDVLIWHPNSKEFELDGRPYDRMEFYAHVSNESYNNKMTVTFSTDNGASWGTSSQFDIPREYDWANPFMCTFIPDGANRVKFTTTSTTYTFFNMVKMVQESYLRAKDMVGNNLAEIVIDDAIVNEPFSRTFTVEYSDVPLIQYSVTDSHDLGLKLEPNPTISNDCGDWGTYTFTLTGESPYPQSDVKENIRLYTSAGDEVVIPITITATLSEPFYFNVQDGDWNESTNWTHKGSTTHGMVPDKRFPVVVSKALQIGNESTTYEAVAYNVTIESNGRVNISSKGGLTLHAGGFAEEGVTEDNFVIDNTPQGAGFVRVSPFFTGTMPKAKVNFTTKANMDAGDNRNAAWQYIGAPGRGASLQKEASTVLYLRSEEWGWLPYWNESVVALEPFAGYALTQKEQPDFTFQSQLINEDQTIQLTYTEEGMKGDNLWANSYMAPLDITKFSQEDFTGNVDRTFYLYNSGSWNDWNKDQSATNDANVYTPGRYYAINFAKIDATKDQTVIPPMQGVYMKAGEGGGTLTINYEKHVWNNSQTGKMNTPLRIAPHSEENQSADFLRIRLQVNSENSGADRMYVIQDSLATSGYDNGYDAAKQMATGLMNIYTNEPFGKMEISSTDHMDGMYIGFAAGEDEVYTMTFTSLIGEDLYLYDVEQDTLVGMYNGEKYEFAAAANSTNDMRFQILVNPDLTDYLPNGGNGGGVTTDTEDVDAQPLWVHDEKVYIAHASINSTLEVYTISGVAIARYTIGYAPCTLDMSALPTGVYMLRLNDQVYKFVCE